MKMCPYCGNQIEDKEKICPYCNRELKKSGIRIYFSKNDSQNIGNGLSIFMVIFACIFTILIIFIPACYIMMKNNPLGSGVNNKKISCRNLCDSVSYELFDNERYCMCKNSDVYNMKSGLYLFNRDSVLIDKISSYRDDNINKFSEDYNNGDKILILLQSEDNYSYIPQLNSFIHFSTNNEIDDIKIHYIEYDLLSKNDKSRLGEIFNEEVNVDEILVVLIDDGQVVYKGYNSFFHFESSDLVRLLYEYSFLEV